MKWFTSLLSVLFLASLMSLNVGCGGSTKSTDIDAADKAVQHAPGHAQAVKDMGQKPEGVK